MVLIEELHKILNKEIESLKTHLISPGVDEYYDYKREVGKVEGLEWAKTHLQHIVKQRLYEDEE